MKQIIYVTEDDENIRNLICVALENFGYAPEGFETAEEVLDRLQQLAQGKLNECFPSLLIFDWMLPGVDGMEAICQLRRLNAFQRLPILMLTAKDRETDIVIGLNQGADDYMTKPFGILELSARVKNLLKRMPSAQAEPEKVEAGSILLELETREVFSGGEKVELTLKEYELLSYLLEHKKRVVTRDELLDQIWGYDYAGESRTLDMHIKTLRQKLKEGGAQIKTVRGVGYRFLEEAEHA